MVVELVQGLCAEVLASIKTVDTATKTAFFPGTKLSKVKVFFM